MKSKQDFSYINLGLAAILIILAACTAGTRPVLPDTSGGAEAAGYTELLDALRDAGATVEPAEPVNQAFLNASGQIVRVDGADVQVFEYADESAREADSDAIPEDGSSFPTIMVTWVGQPHFWAQGRLIVLYVGSDQAIIDLLNDLLGDPIAG
jgi:hypothetical protein